jgi:hypothetical protein
MLKLYEEVDQLQVVLDWMTEHEEEIAAAGGELPPELLELLEQVEGSVETKLENTALVALNLSANAKAAKAEADRLGAIATSYARQADSLKNYLHQQMERAGIKKHEGARAKLWIQANGAASVRLRNPDYVPQPFRRVRIEFDAAAANAYLKANNCIPKPEDGPIEIEGLVVSRGTHLRIR